MEQLINKDLTVFQQFGKTDKKKVNRVTTNLVVAYSRVSSKEQTKNMSLPFQRQTIDEYAKRMNLNIVEYFGGYYESAKTDGRKEFQRMLNFIKSRKGKISQILVTHVDRFSRTGGKAIQLAEELRENYGVVINSITQPTDVTNASGVLKQNLDFLFSNYDNSLRGQKIKDGMLFRLEKGIWVGHPPQGYDSVTTNGTRTIVVNETGRLLKQAFEWRAEGYSHKEILVKLRLLGVKNMYKQQLSKIFQNPFYCGLISHRQLQGRVIEGIHEAIISKDLFLRVNNIISQNSRYKVKRNFDNEDLPMRRFIKCEVCQSPFTGYLVKSKNIYYYKCRTIGCRCNINRDQTHDLFSNFLRNYTIKEKAIPVLKNDLITTYRLINEQSSTNATTLSRNLTEIERKIENIEEKFYALNEMDKDTFMRFHTKFISERDKIKGELEKSSKTISNLENAISKALEISSQLAPMWTSSDTSLKTRLQSLVFPEGIYYNRQNGAFRTERVNVIFEMISTLTKDSDQLKKGQNQVNLTLSLSAVRAGFEPAVRFPVRQFSKLVVSASHPPHQTWSAKGFP